MCITTKICHLLVNRSREFNQKLGMQAQLNLTIPGAAAITAGVTEHAVVVLSHRVQQVLDRVTDELIVTWKT